MLHSKGTFNESNEILLQVQEVTTILQHYSSFVSYFEEFFTKTKEELLFLNLRPNYIFLILMKLLLKHQLCLNNVWRMCAWLNINLC